MNALFLLINIALVGVFSAHVSTYYSNELSALYSLKIKVCDDVTIDATLMIDISVSALSSYDKVQPFTQNFVTEFFHRIAPGRARVSFVIFSDACRQLIGLGQGTSFERLKQVSGRVRYLSYNLEVLKLHL